MVCFLQGPFVGVWMCACQHGNSGVVGDIIIKFLREQDMVKTSDKFENGCTPVYCDARWSGL